MGYPLLAAYYSLGGYITGAFGGFWLALLINFLWTWFLKLFIYQWGLDLPTPSADPPNINQLLDLAYPALWVLFSAIGAIQSKYSTRTSCEYSQYAPLEFEHSAYTFGISWLGLLLCYLSLGFYSSAVIDYPWNYPLTWFILMLVLITHYMLHRSNVSIYEVYIEKHGMGTETFFRSIWPDVDCLYIWHYALGWGITIIVFSQYFTALLAPYTFYQDVYTQWITLAFMLIFLVCITVKFRVNPLQWFEDNFLFFGTSMEPYNCVSQEDIPLNDPEYQRQTSCVDYEEEEYNTNTKAGDGVDLDPERRQRFDPSMKTSTSVNMGPTAKNRNGDMYSTQIKGKPGLDYMDIENLEGSKYNYDMNPQKRQMKNSMQFVNKQQPTDVIYVGPTESEELEIQRRLNERKEQNKLAVIKGVEEYKALWNDIKKYDPETAKVMVQNSELMTKLIFPGNPNNKTRRFEEEYRPTKK